MDAGSRNESVTPPRMPVLFVGHGSPMNALEENAHSRALQALGLTLPRPKAIVCLSAHWQEQRCSVTHMTNPRTIHDFYGFPRELFEMRYPAPGCPALAEKIAALVGPPEITLDSNWGLDHGAWAVLSRLYPAADIPVVQLSLVEGAEPDFYFHVGRKIQSLRDEGILILGSGNIVHNLKEISWEPGSRPHSWAISFDAWVTERLLKREFSILAEEALKRPDGQMSHPSTEHLMPLFAVLGASAPGDKLQFHLEEIQNASISLRTLSLGA